MTARRRLTVAAIGLASIVGVYVIGGLRGDGSSSAAGSSSGAVGPGNTGPARGGTPDVVIQRLQTRVQAVPKDFVAWAALGLAYVQQAKVTVDPAYYPKAQSVLERSLSINKSDNYVGAAGMAALAAARHDFASAKKWAQRGLKVNAFNATLYGTLADAETQLGNYSAAFAATQRMVDLAPNTASLSRVSYTWELRGKTALARQYMQRALQDATTVSDQAFARYYLGELALNEGDAAGALTQYEAGLATDPAYVPNLEGKAKAEAALGRTGAALADFAKVVDRVPQPAYLAEYGDLLQSLGRTAEANKQYALFDAEQRLFEANGVTGDIDQTLFYANHGQPQRALKYGSRAVKARTFAEVDDAYAWALHVNKRDAEALAWSIKALQIGTRSALFHYHAGMIERALGHTDAAESHLAMALRLNPHFNPLAAPEAARALAALRATSKGK